MAKHYFVINNPTPSPSLAANYQLNPQQTASINSYINNDNNLCVRTNIDIQNFISAYQEISPAGQLVDSISPQQAGSLKSTTEIDYDNNKSSSDKLYICWDDDNNTLTIKGVNYQVSDVNKGIVGFIIKHLQLQQEMSQLLEISKSPAVIKTNYELKIKKRLGSLIPIYKYIDHSRLNQTRQYCIDQVTSLPITSTLRQNILEVFTIPQAQYFSLPQCYKEVQLLTNPDFIKNMIREHLTNKNIELTTPLSINHSEYNIVEHAMQNNGVYIKVELVDGKPTITSFHSNLAGTVNDISIRPFKQMDVLKQEVDFIRLFYENSSVIDKPTGEIHIIATNIDYSDSNQCIRAHRAIINFVKKSMSDANDTTTHNKQTLIKNLFKLQPESEQIKILINAYEKSESNNGNRVNANLLKDIFCISPDTVKHEFLQHLQACKEDNKDFQLIKDLFALLPKPRLYNFDINNKGSTSNIIAKLSGIFSTPVSEQPFETLCDVDNFYRL